jgi:hypothetical protein
MISIYTMTSLIIYSSWQSMNAYQKYQYDKKITYGIVLSVCFSLLMCYWLTKPTVLFLFAKLIDGLFSLALGIYIRTFPIPESQLNHRDKVINGYWTYTITDLAICIVCFFIAVLGVLYG